MRRRLIAGVLCAAAAALTAPLALADTRSFSDERGDLYDEPSSGSRGAVDLVRATHRHSGGRLVHTVTVAGNISNPASSDNAPQLHIESSNVANGTADCSHFVGRHRGRIGVFRCGYGNRVASATVRRTSARTVTFEFSARAIGNPRSYNWAAITRIGSTRYARSVWYIDRMPTPSEGYLTHRLR